MTTTKTTLVAIVIGSIAIFLLLHKTPPSGPVSSLAEPIPSAAVGPDSWAAILPVDAGPPPAPPSVTPAPLAQLTNAPKLSLEEIEDYVAQHKRGAESLLAAFQTTGDLEYLREAARNHADQAAIQFAASSGSRVGDFLSF